VSPFLVKDMVSKPWRDALLRREANSRGWVQWAVPSRWSCKGRHPADPRIRLSRFCKRGRTAMARLAPDLVAHVSEALRQACGTTPA